MLIKMDFESDTPIYMQLRTQIIEGIAAGRLKPGESLPSVRQLASDLGINLHTVNKTYNVLKQDGFIIVHRQKGVVVNPGEGPGITDDYLEQLGDNLYPLIAEAYCRGMMEKDFNKICEHIFFKLKNHGGDNL